MQFVASLPAALYVPAKHVTANAAPVSWTHVDVTLVMALLAVLPTEPAGTSAQFDVPLLAVLYVPT